MKMKEFLSDKLVDKDVETLLEALTMAKVHVGTIKPKDIDGLSNDVQFIRNESPIVDALIDLLGIPRDGTPVRIRTGYMAYTPKYKLLTFAHTKYDMPSTLGKRPAE